MALPSDPQPAPESPSTQPFRNQSINVNPEKLERILWQGKIGPAFWNITSVISLTVNLVLFIILILLGRELFTLKSLISNQLIDGLHSNFVKMDEAHIITTIKVQDNIQVNDSIPVVFDLPLQQETAVTLTKDTLVENATIFLNEQPVPLDIILKQGTRLDIALDLVVPVNQTVPVVLNVPVNLDVPVDIALNQTDLHEPFVGLQRVVSPYKDLLEDAPDSWSQTPLCAPLPDWACKPEVGEQ